MPRPRSYSFDHFKTPKRLPTERMDITKKSSIKGATHRSKKKEVPPSEREALHYGMEHAETVRLTQEHRLKATSRRAAAGKPIERGTKAIARALAAAKRKVARAVGKSPAKKRAKKS
jgi:predicted DNA-binding protein (UPF0251 family)